jgi:hypothetical protein
MDANRASLRRTEVRKSNAASVLSHQGVSVLFKKSFDFMGKKYLGRNPSFGIHPASLNRDVALRSGKD